MYHLKEHKENINNFLSGTLIYYYVDAIPNGPQWLNYLHTKLTKKVKNWQKLGKTLLKWFSSTYTMNCGGGK